MKMKKNKIAVIALLLVLAVGIAFSSFAKNISYMPDVQKEMSHSDFWTTDNGILMTSEEIAAQSILTVSS